MYRSALRKADKEGRAVTSYFFAGHLARKAYDTDQALQFARAAHEYFDSPEAAQQLGNMLVWVKEFSVGQEYLEYALEKAYGKTRLISLTSMVDSWKRWSQHLLDHDKNAYDAAHYAYNGFSIGAKELRSGVYDKRLAANTLDSAYEFVKAVTVEGIGAGRFSRKVHDVVSVITTYRPTFQRCIPWRYAPGFLGKLARTQGLEEYTSTLLDSLLSDIDRPVDTPRPESGLLAGIVRSWRGTYGFIEHPDYPNNVFFPASVIEGLEERGESVDLTGRSVRFSVPVYDEGEKARSGWVSLN